MIWVVGLTGGIGSGKSAAAALFASRGAAIVDADALAHELCGPGGEAVEAIRQAFGEALVTADGALNRPAMRRQVFADPQARQRLESLLHPRIRAESEARLHRLASADFPYALLVVPLLVESGDYRERIDRLCVVDCPEEVQIARTMARSGLSREEVVSIMATQASREARRAAADDLIDNGGTPDELAAQVDRLHARYCQLATSA